MNEVSRRVKTCGSWSVKTHSTSGLPTKRGEWGRPLSPATGCICGACRWRVPLSAQWPTPWNGWKNTEKETQRAAEMFWWLDSSIGTGLVLDYMATKIINTNPRLYYFTPDVFSRCQITWEQDGGGKTPAKSSSAYSGFFGQTFNETKERVNDKSPG